ncbi:Acetyltransferase (GNAT) domain-containing protein [Clostridium cavendishii DSM 21758]|uniref:Acetyltransferase (GNAT) domain-containing protein n=1 Tax=Clostridium cavendishii DSM 21758 TaxID=1121302 RepID=A0A1M6JDP8_9CLOT|nr:GNAT family N-acetyltransferase [Clostridium cavendishii]SHJ44784.1 Acetyltransferase (GNAT) domain-containing protein [Clostridium cavendishii DSM 21758]
MLKYKKITLENIDEMVGMYIETFNSPPWNDSWTITTATKRLHQMITVEDFYGLCAYQNDELCGIILGNMEQYFDGIIFNIKEFCVRNTMRGHGVGSIIFKEFEARLKNMGVKEIILLTSRGEHTEHFYHKQGLESYSDLIFMGKKL